MNDGPTKFDLNQEILSLEMARRRDAAEKIEALAHYTSAGAALSILQSKEIEMSSITMMNDMGEVVSGAKIVEEIYSSRFDDKPFLDSFRNTHDNIRHNTYAFCFSGHSHSEDIDGRLSMWRAYAANGDGACLILRREPLVRKEILDFPAVSIVVNYETRQEFAVRVGEFFDHLVEIFDKYKEQIAALDPDFVNTQLAFCMTMLALSHKHKAFLDEREVRLVHIREHWPISIGGIFYDSVARGRILKPILRLPIRAYPEAGMPDTELENLLLAIIVGPSDNRVMQAEAFRIALTRIGLGHVPVRYSEIPFRAPRS